ncbi:hypothetical protein AMTRI_Chr12g269140 [Amborella trichopoda]
MTGIHNSLLFVSGSLQIAQICRPVMKSYEYLMGLIIFTPVVVPAWFPFVSEFETKLLFNQAFNRGPQIQKKH